MSRIKQIAFTLIELLVVIAIIGILSGLIVVTMSGVTSKANIAKSQVFSNSLRNALMLNLVSEWKLDGNAVDTWGGKNGTLHGTTSVTTDCPQSTCLSFNGTSDYINVVDDTVFNFGTQMTAMIWEKGGSQSGKYLLAQYDTGLNKRSWMVRTSSSTMEMYISDDGTLNSGHVKRYRTNSAFFDNNWHLLGFTWNSGTLKLYADGADQAVTKVNDDAITSLYNSDADLTIGCGMNSGSSNDHFAGQLDEVRTYNVVIPTAQIEEIYYSGLNNLLINGAINRREYMSRFNNYASSD
jgi:prepilin-type N-terminal cleavage/methylation domain-containing protein